MTPFQRILVPTDFSECSDRAIALAVRMAGALDSSLVLLHAVDQAQNASVLASTSGAIAPGNLGTGPAQRSLDETLRATRDVWPRTEAILRLGIPSEEILRAAGDFAADLIVMGTHGHRGLLRALVGSVTEKTVRTSTVPVLTVRGP
jgi:nucleotide-binding universal stress UspA family protein